ncbi:unnamed protein product [Moneuplotes crassus]|uniref:Uncharacterized protein n=1 Tax=Euplotes crassus TaxID=5936 RepID=A0AAD1XL69_EUPCR|nr:unnamed protein product [Moneuplotes crassus]
MKIITVLLFLTIANLCYASSWQEELLRPKYESTYAESVASNDYFNMEKHREEAFSSGFQTKVPSAPVLVLEPMQHACQFRIYNYIGQVLNTYSRCIEVATDEWWIINKPYDISRHGEDLCKQVQSDEVFKNGNFSIISFSDGGMLARYLIEYCHFDQPIRNVVTMGAPLNGVSAISHQKRSSLFGSILDWIVDKLIKYEFMDRFIIAADYWRDPRNVDGYLHYSRFLAEANNEVNFDEDRKDAWMHINHGLFVKWEDDTTIIPKESSHWAIYDQHFEVIDRHDTILFQQDLIGLQTLEKNEQTSYITLPGDHLKFNFTQINDLILPTLRM